MDSNGNYSSNQGFPTATYVDIPQVSKHRGTVGLGQSDQILVQVLRPVSMVLLKSRLINNKKLVFLLNGSSLGTFNNKDKQ